MKRLCSSRVDQPHKRKSGIPPDRNIPFDESTAGSLPVEDVFRTRIAEKLQMLLETANVPYESNNEDEERKPDISSLLNADKSNSSSQGFINCAKNKITELIKRNTAENNISCNEEEYDAHIALPLQNFINSAKSQLTDLLRRSEHKNDAKELLQQPMKDDGEKENKELANTSGSNAQVMTKTLNVGPLQTQISLKLQSVLCKDNILHNGFESGSDNEALINSDVISESDWQNFSNVLVDFLNSAKNKFTQLLSKQHTENQSQNEALSTAGKCNQSISPEALSEEQMDNQITDPEPVTEKEFTTKSSCQKQLAVLPTEQQNSQNTNVGCSTTNQTWSHSTRSEPSTKFNTELVINVENVNPECNADLLIIEHSYSKRPNLELSVTEKESSCSKTDTSKAATEVPMLCDVTPEIIVIEAEFPKKEHEVIDLVDDEDEASILEEIHKCPKCRKVFRAESLLRFHIRMHDAGSPLMQDSDPKNIISSVTPNIQQKEKLYHCSDCSLKFSQKRSFERHRKMHNKVAEPYKHRLRKKQSLGGGHQHKFCNACKDCF